MKRTVFFMAIMATFCIGLLSTAALAAEPAKTKSAKAAKAKTKPVKPGSIVVPLVQIGVGDMSAEQTIGTVTFSDTDKGLEIVASLSQLAPGEHGFHIHTFPSCAAKEEGGKMVPGLAAGGHYDPRKTQAHLGPDNMEGHAGDLPVLKVNADGKANQTILAKGLKLDEIRGRSIIVHSGGDNYGDAPLPNGGGAMRIACGVIP